MRDEAQMPPEKVIPPSPSIYAELKNDLPKLAAEPVVAVSSGPCVYDADGKLSLGELSETHLLQPYPGP